ncbi:molybdopterin-dependent oxidoreductase [Roseovarius sp. Pro17]|uniref:molybdopterin-dependent oxidoreductase n=1 Tax=Roseovarius sp. Pro17 TaxID=3108175 RepID=UPI002D779E07|nr:molybdopterin-dependent oxidoreductase [Roseovarius sp. Pro17]
MSRLFTRRKLLTGVALATPAVLVGCDRLGAAPSFRETVLRSGEWLSYRVHRLIGSNALAREYTKADLSPDFRTNGNTDPGTQEYRRHVSENFANWQLQVSGLVEQPKGYTLSELKSRPARTQITRHDCVEGWSAIGGWTGVPLRTILEDVQLKPEARYIVFQCADSFGRMSPTPYYESIDLVDAFHPQTILAYGMNGSDLPIGHGAPVRLRVERQLGYKHAKFIMRIKAVATLAKIGGGKGGYWEDVGFYDWYAGI